MVFPVLLLAALGATWVLFAWMRRIFVAPHPWRRIAAIASAVAVLRAGAAGAGGWVLANDSSWLQLPAYFLVNLGLPEIALSGRQSPAAPEAWYWRAMGIVALGSLVWVLGTAAAARAASAAFRRKLEADPR